MDSSGVNVMMDQFVISGIGVWAIQKLKAWSGLPVVREGATKANRILSSLVAVLSASGILISTNWVSAEHTFSLVVTGLTASNISLFVWMALKSFILQQGWWELVKAAQKNG